MLVPPVLQLELYLLYSCFHGSENNITVVTVTVIKPVETVLIVVFAYLNKTAP